MQPASLRLIRGTGLSAVTLLWAIDHYLNRKAARGARPNTLAAYGSDLKQFAECLDYLHGQTPLVAVLAPRDVSHWLDELQARGVSARSQARKLTVVRGFFKHAQREGWTGIDPTKGESVSFRAKRVVAPELPELLAMIENIPTNDRIDIRDRAMLRLALDTGLRIGCVGSIDAPGFGTATALDMPRQIVHFINKGGEVETSAFNDRTKGFLDEWLRIRSFMADAEEPALFVSQRGCRLSRAGMHEAFKRHATAAGLGNAHWHLLRHRRVRGVCEALGTKVGQQFAHHRNESTTSDYGDHAQHVAMALVRQQADLDTLARKEAGRARA